MMRIGGLAALAMLLLAGCAGQGAGDRFKRPLAVNPSAFIAAEIGFARLAQEKGQWTAFRETSHPDAVMFVPHRVKARDWLKSQTDPAESVKWQPHAVYVSCDGNAAATTGAWQKGAASGYFSTIWLRDPRSGEISWVLDHGDTLSAPRPAPDFIASRQASCEGRPAPAGTADENAAGAVLGQSADRTMSWSSIVRPDGSRSIVVRIWNGKAMEELITDHVAAPVTEAQS